MKNIKLNLGLIILFMLIVLGIYGYVYIYTNQSKESVSDTAIMYYENVVAITFDDGPRSSTTPILLDGLKELGVTATFFLIGKNIVGNEDIIKRMYDEGHLIGNHTYSHIRLSTVSHNRAVEDIQRENKLIFDITGYMPKYIRPPFGTFSDVLQLEIDMTSVMWSYDPRDWDNCDTNCIVKTVVENVKSGDIILMHDIYDTSVAAALEIIAQLKAKGYVFVTVDQLVLD